MLTREGVEIGLIESRSIGTLLVYADEHDRVATQRTLADSVAGTTT